MIYKAITDLEKEILDSELDTELKKFLLDRLEEMRKAIIGYRLHGTEPLTRATVITAIEIGMKQELINKYKKNGIMKKFFGIAVAISKVIQFADKYKKYLPAFNQLLLGTGSDLPE